MGCKLCKGLASVKQETIERKRHGKRSGHHDPRRHRSKVEIIDIQKPSHDDLDGVQHETQTLLPTKDEVVSRHSIVVNEFVDIEASDPEAFNRLFIQQRQLAIDNLSYRSTIESWQPDSLEQLTEIIKTFSEEKSLIDRHSIIFYWIVCNIEYDVLSYFAKDYKDQSAEGVFGTKKGVCAGYANLYKYLCDQLQIPCEIVGGYSKGYGFDDREEALSETDHAWNAVQIDGHWYLMESTWGAGHLNKEKTFERKLNSYYFLPRPNEMIYHHLPENDKWQFLRTPINMTQYMQMPKVHPTYFEFDLELVSPRNQAHVDFLPDKSYALVLVRAPSHVRLIAGLTLNDQKIEGGHRVVFDNQKQLYCCYFAPSTVGKHKITIYGKHHGTKSDTYNAALDLTFNVKQMPPNPISFPETWKNFFALGLEVVSPQNTHLIRLNNGINHVEVQIKTPQHVQLIGCLKSEEKEEVIGGDCVYYDRRNDTWRCQLAPHRDGIFDAVIMAKKKDDSGNYTSAVSFKIDAKQIPSPPLSYPKTWQLFHDLDIKIETPRDQGMIVLSENESEVEIHIRTSDNVDLLGQLKNDNDDEIEGGHDVFYDRNAGFWRCKFAPNQAGTFKALVMAKKKDDSENYTSAVSFKIDAKQISSPPVSYPHAWPLFYDLGLRVEAPKNRANAVWPDNASYAEIMIQAPDDIILSCKIKYNDLKIENGTLAQFDYGKKLWQLLFAPERTGPHELIVYAKRRDDNATSSPAVVKFTLNVTGLRQAIKFPIIYTQFQTKNCQIYNSLYGVLKADSIVLIHCVIPNAVDVNLTVDSQWLESEGYTDPILRRQITVGSKEVIIYAKDEEKSNYYGLMKYTTQ